MARPRGYVVWRPPDVLARIVLEAIEAQIDLDVLAGVKREEVKQRAAAPARR